jgi:hypothetical protein
MQEATYRIKMPGDFTPGKSDEMVKMVRTSFGVTFQTNQTSKYCVGFEVLTAVAMQSTIYWDITPCSPLSVNRRFGGTYCLHLHGRKNKFSRNSCRRLPPTFTLLSC